MFSLTRVGLHSKALLRPSLARAITIPGLPQVPQPPGNIIGTVNDAYVPPPPHKLEGSIHWTSERIVSVGLVPLTLAPFLTGASTIVDSTLSALLLYHCYAGFQSCITDYIPSRTYGKYHNYANYLLLFGTGVAGYGIYDIETREGGLGKVVSKVWKA
ncbi:uncharacterized protein CANTADRAFT_6010 [Suhomyces tanzawaensis NRRL Y-17324]|uniref:Succinate dehydrogenase [ubiquinone] cytochrome b small subunit n=1 Tax=Suhomyces tanzawaensis NRRL Y-17324 TaxID=984487 RepID=A0A1E4SLH0_9ASCO|nr:uncharacterized protein CANTADRAFT_6010 [Suhomyces tanzawaensis NRRL Y-17324]ODV80371.1 hypothetical protein CANTADRAFT_6010 [Suhomyces tanzawaensis NRRL Y-17324]